MDSHEQDENVNLSFPVRVWAPHARDVELVISETSTDHTSRNPFTSQTTTMTKGDGGWWTALPIDLGTDYWFRVDNKGPFPDPRSLWQPHGVDGPSRAWNPQRYGWVNSPVTQNNPILGQPLYELHVGTFTSDGTLLSAIDRLDDLLSLGVRTVELMPLAQFSGKFGWGYDGVNLFSVHQTYGGPNAYVQFVNEAHRRGLAVCIDVVLNHVGPWGNYLSEFGPYYSDRHTTPWGPGFDLDGPHSSEPRSYLLDVCRHWLVDMHADALRLDAVHAIYDNSPTHILKELAEKVAHWEQEERRPMTLIAESDLNQPSLITSQNNGGMGMDAQWADDVHHGIHVVYTGETKSYYEDFADPTVLPHVLEHVFRHDGCYSTFREKIWGAPVPDDMDRFKFVVFSQNHDQVGNRARGDRPSESLNDAQLAGEATLVILSSFTPLLFQGEEWGTRTPFCFFAGQETEERARSTREGRTQEFSKFGWEGTVPDPTDIETFYSSKLQWSERDQPREQQILRWYQSLMSLRTSLMSPHDSIRKSSMQNASREGSIVRTVVFDLAIEVDLQGLSLPDVTTPGMITDSTHYGGTDETTLQKKERPIWPENVGSRLSKLIMAFPSRSSLASMRLADSEEDPRTRLDHDYAVRIWTLSPPNTNQDGASRNLSETSAIQ